MSADAPTGTGPRAREVAAILDHQGGALAAAVGRRVVAVGVDLVEVDRVRTALARTEGFADRVYTPAEQAWAERVRDPAERLALRWAVKEATMKALGAGIGTLPLTAIEVVRDPSGEIGVVLHPPARERATERRVGSFLVSGTHTATLASAVVIALADA